MNACGDNEGGNYNFSGGGSGGGCSLGCFGYVIGAVLVIIVLALLLSVELNGAVLEFLLQIVGVCLAFGWINNWGKK